MLINAISTTSPLYILTISKYACGEQRMRSAWFMEGWAPSITALHHYLTDALSLYTNNITWLCSEHAADVGVLYQAATTLEEMTTDRQTRVTCRHISIKSVN